VRGIIKTYIDHEGNADRSVDRLEPRGLVERGQVGDDRRATRVQLTAKGEVRFHQVFQDHAKFLRPFFAQALNASEFRQPNGYSFAFGIVSNIP
jgi:DNA-binding MarR family transcriptional regulator